MSERKTAEIKFRVTPSEKARWQMDADGEGVSVSELIRRRMNVADIKVRLEQSEVELQRDAISDLPCSGFGSCISGRGCNCFPGGKQNPFAATTLEDGTPMARPQPGISNIDRQPPEDVRINSLREHEPCPHGTPMWAWCSECHT